MLLFNRSQDWIVDKSRTDINAIIIHIFNTRHGFKPHYSQVHTIFAIINTGNPYDILKNPEKAILSEASISHVQTTAHGRNKLMVAKNGKNVNIFLNKQTETAYIDIAIECSIRIISDEIKADLIKYMILDAFMAYTLTPVDILKVITFEFIASHLKNE